MDEEKELEKLQLGTYVEHLQNAISVILGMIPAEPSAEYSRILRALHGINEVKSYLEAKHNSYKLMQYGDNRGTEEFVAEHDAR